jgi:hypothetical protein
MLDARPRPGKAPKITAEAQASRVSPYWKATDLDYPHPLRTTRLLARQPRERGPAEDHACLDKRVEGKSYKVRCGLERREPEFKLAQVRSVPPTQNPRGDRGGIEEEALRAGLLAEPG